MNDFDFVIVGASLRDLDSRERQWLRDQNGGKHRSCPASILRFRGEHTMGLTVCRAAVVAAPAELVSGNLVQWERYAEWADVRVQRTEPEGPATVGQTVYFAGKDLGRTLALHLQGRRDQS